MKPISKKPEFKSPVKSSMGLMDRIFNFVGAIVGGIVVKALPGIIETIKKVIEYVKPIFAKIQEGLQPVFTFIGGFFKDTGSYDSEKEKVNENIEEANLIGKDIDGQTGELTKAGEDIENENKGLGKSSNALGGEEKGLLKDREERKEDNEEMKEFNEERNELKKEAEIAKKTGETDISGTLKKQAGGEEFTSDPTTVTLESSNTTSEDPNFLDKVSKSEFTGVKVLTAPVAPVREDFPRTRAGMKAYMTAVKNYNIQYKEFKQTQKNLIKPSNSNKNGLTALNTTGGLTSANGSGSTTIIRQRQIVRVPVPITV